MNERHPIRVMIVDDHPIVRDGLISLVEAYEDLELVAEVGSGRQALAACDRDLPDVILMDMVMPEMDGPATTQAILGRYPDVKVIALTSFPEEDLIQRALQAGAISYLFKSVDTETLANAIRAAHRGHSTLAPEVTRALTHSAASSALGDDLTEREREALAFIVQGKSNDEIAEMMVISLATAKRHVSVCISKLGASNRAQAAALAIQHSLVPDSA